MTQTSVYDVYICNAEFGESYVATSRDSKTPRSPYTIDGAGAASYMVVALGTTS